MTIRSSKRAAERALRRVAACALLLCASPSSAQPTTSPADAARALYVEGKDLRRSGDLARSLEKLEAAHALYATPITALEAARAHALLGHYKKAVQLLESIAALPVKPGESQKAADARTESAALLAQYRERLGTMRLRVEPTSARVLVDGDEVPESARASWPVDPGVHHVVAALGEERRTEEVRVGDGEARDVSLTLVAPAPPAPAAPVGPVAPHAEPPAPAVPPPELTVPREAPPPARTTSPLAYAGFGVAAAGALTGTITGLMTLSRASTLRRECRDGACLPDAHLQTAQTLGTISTVAFAVGGAGLLVGIGALVFGGSSEPPRAAVRVAPWIGAGRGGASTGIGGTFQ